MAYTPNVVLINGGFTDFEGSPLDMGYLVMALSHDEQYTVGLNQVVAGLKLRIALDSNGNIPASPATKVFANDAMLPSGSFYIVRAFKADGTEAWASEQFWTILSSPSTLDVGTIVPTNPPGGGGSGSSSLLLQTNGTNNTNQSLLNIAQGTNVTITNVSGTTTINASGASFTTTNQGWFLGGQSFAPISDDTGHAVYSSLSANTVVAVQIVLQATWKISSMAVFCITGSSIQGFAAGLYSIDGNTKLIDSGPITIPAASQKYIPAVLGSPVTVPPGVYWFAYGATTNSGQPSILAHQEEIWFTAMINGIDFTNPQTLPTRYGTCANPLSAGALPATLGAITPLDNTDSQFVPAVLFIV